LLPACYTASLTAIVDLCCKRQAGLIACFC